MSKRDDAGRPVRTTRWGVFDTIDRLWYGTDAGPKLFDQELHARASAQVIDVQLRQPAGRSRAREWSDGTARVVHELPILRTPLQAWRHIEGGGL